MEAHAVLNKNEAALTDEYIKISRHLGDKKQGQNSAIFVLPFA